jgi:hypothetical protein
MGAGFYGAASDFTDWVVPFLWALLIGYFFLRTWFKFHIQKHFTSSAFISSFQNFMCSAFPSSFHLALAILFAMPH